MDLENCVYLWKNPGYSPVAFPFISTRWTNSKGDFWVYIYLVSSFIFLSKFAPDGEINARFGWSMCYGVPAVVYAVLWSYSGMPQSIFHLVAMATYLGHFMKRILEVLFLHKYSKKMSLVPAIEVISYSKPRGGTP